MFQNEPVLNNILLKVEEVREAVNDLSLKVTTYVERVDNVVRRVDYIEERVHGHSEALAEHTLTLAVFSKLLAVLGGGFVTLIAGLLLYFFTHR